MKPGTKPKPTHLKLVTGNPGKRTLNRKEAKAKAAIPAPPAHLTPDAVEEWKHRRPRDPRRDQAFETPKPRAEGEGESHLDIRA